MSDYYSFWGGYNTVVVVDYEDIDAALPAALYASYLNIPLIFADQDHQTNLPNANNKIIHLINRQTHDAIVVEYVENVAKNGQVVDYTTSDLQLNRQLNPYSTLVSEIYVP